MNHWSHIARLSASEIKDLQNRKLHAFINQYLYPFSKHYQELFDAHKIQPQNVRTVADLQQIPFTSKENFIDPVHKHPSADATVGKFREFILTPDPAKIKKAWPLPKLLELKATSWLRGPAYVKDRLEREFRPIFITFTTGTTQRPISYLYSHYDIQNLYLSGSRMIDLFNITREEHILNMFPYAPHLAFWQVVFGGLSSCVLIMSTGGGKVMGTEGNVAALQKMRPSVILGVPSYVYHVLRSAREKGCRFESIKKVVLGASKVPIAFKLKLAELLASLGAPQASIFGTYGFTEARTAWAECPTTNDISSGYHLYPDKEIFEIVDPKTRKVCPEESDGELVYTSIDSRGSSVIRYRTGDFVKGGITWRPCPHCRRTVPRISSDITRLSDLQDVHITKIKGSLVNFNNFAETLSGFSQVEEWQIELRKKDNDPFEVDEVVVYLTTKGEVDQAALAETVKRRLLVATEISPNEIRFVNFSDMVKRLEIETASKEKRIIDNRPKI